MARQVYPYKKGEGITDFSHSEGEGRHKRFWGNLNMLKEGHERFQSYKKS